MVLLAVYFLSNSPNNPKKINEGLFKLNEEETADYFIQGLQLEHYTNGELNYRIHAEKLLHFQENNLFVFMKPNFYWFHHAAGKSWLIHSDLGKLEQDKQRFQFEQHVQLHNVPMHNIPSKTMVNHPVLVTTENLDVLLDQNLAFTQAEVLATLGENQSKSQISAQGMRLMLVQDKIEFLKQVETQGLTGNGS